MFLLISVTITPSALQWLNEGERLELVCKFSDGNIKQAGDTSKLKMSLDGVELSNSMAQGRTLTSSLATGLMEVVLNVTQTSIRPADAGTYSCKYDSSSVTTTNVIMVLSGQICMIHYQQGLSNISL